jgi:hypothetical protein
MNYLSQKLKSYLPTVKGTRYKKLFDLGLKPPEEPVGRDPTDVADSLPASHQGSELPEHCRPKHSHLGVFQNEFHSVHWVTDLGLYDPVFISGSVSGPGIRNTNSDRIVKKNRNSENGFNVKKQQKSTFFPCEQNPFCHSERRDTGKVGSNVGPGPW